MIEEKGRRCLFAGASYHAAIDGENVHTHLLHWLLLLTSCYYYQHLQGLSNSPSISHVDHMHARFKRYR
jgi:hypothetical protein